MRNMRNLPRLGLLAASAALLVSGALTTAPPASAASDDAISGQDNWRDDWWNEGTISTSSYSYSNVAAMWQQILWADGLLEWSEIDCRFGRDTRQATIWWQQYKEIAADGMVGPETFKAASERLVAMDGSIRYIGATGNRNINFWRGSDGKWSMSISGDVKVIWYEKATFKKCT
ncbi:peptidoglycan-binding domain-containing protein [Streptomyces roseifaciens]